MLFQRYLRIQKPLLSKVGILTGVFFWLQMMHSPVLANEMNDFVVYSVYSNLNMGNPGEKTRKDFYVNMGKAHGLKVGSRLNVLRKTATYNLISKKLFKDVTFPIAILKVIHVEEKAAITRFVRFLPDETTPAITPQAIMVGDLVQPVR